VKLDRFELAEKLGVSLSAVDTWRMNGLPSAGKRGHDGPGKPAVVYELAAVRAWVAARGLAARPVRAGRRLRRKTPRRQPGGGVVVAAGRGRGGRAVVAVAQPDGVCLRCGAETVNTWCVECRPVARDLMQRGFSIVQIGRMGEASGCAGDLEPELGYRRQSVAALAAGMSSADRFRRERVED
jgi:hypothetical protein